MPNHNPLRSCSHLVGGCSTLLVFFMGSASSQEQEESSAANAAGARASLDEITVTASRVTRDGFTAPTPTTTITSDEVDAIAVTNVAEALNQLPALRPSLTPSSTTNLTTFSGGNFLDLRGLGYNRTLVLVDGKRFVPTNVEGPVDIDVIPQAMIRSIEVVTGGASAAWGADAVAGVANFLLDHELEGVRGVAQGGTSTHGDRENWRVSVAFGNGFAAGRGHVLLGAESASRNGIDSRSDRDWGRTGWARISNPAYTPDNDEPRLLLVPNVTSSNQSFGGLINAGPLAGIQFDSNGNPIPFNYGDLQTGSTMVGGDGPATAGTQTLETPLDRHSLYGSLSFELMPSVTAFAEASWARSATKYNGLVRRDTALTIQRDNPFLPAAIGEAMDGLGLVSFRMGRFNRDYGQVVNDKWTETRRGVAGLEGEFGEGWRWDAYYTRGRSETQLRNINNRIISKFDLALDATTDPLTGAVVCRSLEARAAGCVPINLFGEGAPSTESLGYIMGSSQRNDVITQDNVAATLRGDPFQMPAGPVAVAAGLEWRREKADVTSDPLSVAGSFATGNTVPWDGRVSVKEAFVEAVLPFVADARWTQSLDLNLAMRITDYSTSDTVNSWKIGGVWQANNLLRFRATQSRDIRAPSLAELFVGGVTSTFNVFDPELGITSSVQSIRSGFAGLDPEEADTTTAGIVLSPLPNLMLSLDYYNIKVDKAITTFQAANIVQRCYSIQPEICQLIERDSVTGEMTAVHVAPQNLQNLEVSGADLEVVYTMPIGPGDLRIRALASYLDELILDDGEVASELAGSVAQPTIASLGGQPHWKWSLNVGYGTGRVALSAAARYIGGGQLDNTFTEKDVNILEHSGVAYYDVGGSYDVTVDGQANATLFVSVKNLLDKDPPVSGVGGFGTTRSLYDVIGRTYLAGVRFHF